MNDLGALGLKTAENIEALRTSQRLTYVELSARLTEYGRPIAVLGLRRIERGERRVDVDDLFALAAALDVQPFELVNGANMDSPEWHAQLAEVVGRHNANVERIGRVRALELAVQALKPVAGAYDLPNLSPGRAAYGDAIIFLAELLGDYIQNGAAA